MERRDGTTLPGAVELSDILEREAKRDLPPGKETVHYVDLDPFASVLEAVGLPTDLLTAEYAPAEVVDAKLIERGDHLIAALVERLSDASRALPQVELRAAYDYLAEEDEPAPADLIFAFGAKTPLRAEKAVALYQAGLAPRLMFSGRSPNYAPDAVAEAETYRRYALDRGVLNEAIITETNSITVPDNVRSSLNLLDARGEPARSFILVNSPYVQRRGWAHFRKYLPDDVRLIRQNCSTAPKFSREQWFRTPDGIKVVANEYVKMKIAASLNTA
jgi:hypothetical protein